MDSDESDAVEDLVEQTEAVHPPRSMIRKARIYIRKGLPRTTTTKKGNPPPFDLYFQLSDGYDNFLSKIWEYMRTHHLNWNADDPEYGGVYYKRAKGTKHIDFERLSSDNFQSLIQRTYNHSIRRQDLNRRDDLIYEMFLYMPKLPTQETAQRAISARLREAATEVRRTIQRMDRPVGNLEENFWILSVAQNRATAAAPPDTATSSQLRHIDDMHRQIPVPNQPEPEYKDIRFKINDQVIRMAVHLEDLRSALGFPMYNMMRQGLFDSQFVNVAPPDDAADEDHINPRTRRPNPTIVPQRRRIFRERP